MSLSSAEIRNIVETLQESAWDQAVVVVGDVQISVARNGAALAGSAPLSALPAAIEPAPARAAVPVPQAPVESAVSQSVVPLTGNAISADGVKPAAETIAGHVVAAPSVGIFWSAPEPGAAPFVAVGQTVQPGDTLCIIEIMKLMNNVSSDVAGEVVAIHTANAAAVEYGTPLFTIRLKD